ncbi:MAG: A24 family peptidase [Oscillospiraceae bacterium]
MLLVFIFGLLIGSFLNVCIYRIPRQESIVFTGSHCTACGTPIKFYDLIPVLSYVLLRGRCRFCKSRISPQYPLIELATAVLITFQAWKWGLTVSFMLFAALTAVLIVVTMVDFYHQIIPDSFIIAIAILGLFYLATIQAPQRGFSAVVDSIVGLFVGGALFFLISFVSKGGMGGGDIKLMAVLGLWFGWKKILLLMLVAFVSGAFISVPLLLMHRKSGKDAVPFGPFIALAAYFISLFGNELLQWYSQYFMMI